MQEIYFNVTDSSPEIILEVIGSGPQGPRGETGATGPAGATGATGATGPAGKDGKDGADGLDGVSPTVEIESITGGHAITITDDEHPNGQTFNVMDGADGLDGAPGPQGEDGPAGPAGQDGDDGYSPTVTVENITGGHRVTITDADGPHVFDVMDGIASEDIFIATYGTTTNAQIETALSAGQEVFCKLTNSGVDYYLPLTRRPSATDHRFAAQYGATDIYTIGASCIDGTWNSWNRRMMPMPSSPSSGDVLSYNGAAWAGKALTASDVGAVASNQGSGNAGKFLSVANDGTVTPVSLPVYNGGVS